jgi:putative acetyltransferase
MYRIELETDRYREEIREVQYTAFKGHPYHEPGAEPTEHKIVDELRNHGALSLSLVAFEGNKVVGHVAFSPVKINIPGNIIHLDMDFTNALRFIAARFVLQNK